MKNISQANPFADAPPVLSRQVYAIPNLPPCIVTLLQVGSPQIENEAVKNVSDKAAPTIRQNITPPTFVIYQS
jgi:hypothetical protein